MSCQVSNPPQQTSDATVSKTKGLGSMAKRFSLSIKKTTKLNKRVAGSSGSMKAQFQKEQRKTAYSTVSTATEKTVSTTSLTSATEDESDNIKCVRFPCKDKKGKKLRVRVIEFERVPEEVIPEYWCTPADMEDTFADVKRTVKHFVKNCDRYVSLMNKVSDSCERLAPSSVEEATDPRYDSVTHQFDKRLIAQLCLSDARGLEHHIAPRMENTRKQVVESVLRSQAALSAASPEKREKFLAAKYVQLSHASKLMAKTLAEGDALVAQPDVSSSPPKSVPVQT